MAAEALKFELVTPSGEAYSDSVYEVMLPTEAGQIAVLPNHMPLVSVATPGVISIRKREGDADSALDHFATSGGIIEIDGHVVRLLADDAEHASEVDELRAREAYEKAQAMRSTADDHVSIAEAEALLEHSMAQLKVADLKRRKHRR